jgi:hypothetical protein
VTLRARWVTLRARWVTLRARWVTLRARWVTSRCGARHTTRPTTFRARPQVRLQPRVSEASASQSLGAVLRVSGCRRRALVRQGAAVHAAARRELRGQSAPRLALGFRRLHPVAAPGRSAPAGASHAGHASPRTRAPPAGQRERRRRTPLGCGPCIVHTRDTRLRTAHSLCPSCNSQRVS